MLLLLSPVNRAGIFSTSAHVNLTVEASLISDHYGSRFYWRRPLTVLPELSRTIHVNCLSSFRSFRRIYHASCIFHSSDHFYSVSEKTRVYSSPNSSSFSSPVNEAKGTNAAQVTKRLENTARYFKRLGSLSVWGQLVCTVVAAVILSFSILISGKIKSPATFYATAGGIVAGFISVFWSFGYIRLSEKLSRAKADPSKAPSRADVVKSLKNGIILNLVGMGSAVLGMQATVGMLVAKALTSSAIPYYQAISPGSSPVLALDVFLVQASGNTILSHFLGLVFSLELLRSVTVATTDSPVIQKLV